MLRRFTISESVKKIARDTAIVFIFFVGVGIASAGTIKIASNMPPVAAADSYATAQETTLNIPAPGVLANDTDPESTTLSVMLDAPTSAGTLTMNGNGSFDYAPNPGFFGTDSFRYKVNDGMSDSNIVTVYITVTRFNHKPVTADDYYATPANEQLVQQAPGVLSNDLDVDHQTLTATLEVGPKYGTAALQQNGMLTYVPNQDFNGIDVLRYRANDGFDDSISTAVSIQVGQHNGEPIAASDSVSTPKDEQKSIDVLANDSDPEGVKHMKSVQSRSAQGGYMRLGAENVEYTPPIGFTGLDTFTYVMTDGSYLETATVTVTVIDTIPTKMPVASLTAPATKSPSAPVPHGVSMPGPYIPTLATGDLIKRSGDATVYWYGADRKRYMFPNTSTYFSWYVDFGRVKVIAADVMASIPLGGMVTHHPGIRMLKMPTDPTVYAVDRYGVVRAIANEMVASRIYGAGWWQMIDDVSETIFGNYTIGEPVLDASQFNARERAASVQTILENQKTP